MIELISEKRGVKERLKEEKERIRDNKVQELSSFVEKHNKEENEEMRKIMNEYEKTLKFVSVPLFEQINHLIDDEELNKNFSATLHLIRKYRNEIVHTFTKKDNFKVAELCIIVIERLLEELYINKIENENKMNEIINNTRRRTTRR